MSWRCTRHLSRSRAPLVGALVAAAVLIARPASAGPPAADSPLFRVWESAKDAPARFGYCDREGKTVIPVRFEQARPFREGLAYVSTGDNWCLIDRSGRVVVRLPQDFTCTSDFSDGMAAVVRGATLNVDFLQGGRWGYVDRDGRVAGWLRSPPVDDWPLNNFSDDRAAVRVGDKWGFLDKKVELRVEAKFDEVRPFSEGVAAVRVGKDWRYIDADGRPAVPGRFNAAGGFSAALAPVTRGDRSAFIDRSGREVFRIRGDWGEQTRFSEHLAAVHLTPRGQAPAGATCWACGADIAGMEYGDPCPNCHRPAGDPKWGFVDEHGAERIAPAYVDCRPFSGGLAAVREKEDGPWGFIDPAGHLVIPCAFASVGPGFTGGVCEVLTPLADTRVVDGVWINEPLPYDALIDGKGHFVWRSPNLIETQALREKAAPNGG